MKIERIDHIVLTVRDVERSCAFYSEVLGMEIITFGNGRKAVRFGEQKINLHPFPPDAKLVAAHPTPGSADLCLITYQTLSSVKQHLEKHGVDIIDGPIERAGAQGSINSFYFRDPDGNLIEVSVYRS